MTPTPAIADALQYASSVTGVSHGFLHATAARESAFDANARAGTSSAAGLFQFIEDTWLRTLAKHGPDLGMADAAERVQFDARGRAQVVDQASRGAVLALRFDPTAAALMAGALARDNAEALQEALARPPSAGELYTAHVLGARGAVTLLTAAEDTPHRAAADIFPAAARANRGLFYDRHGAPVSASGLADRLARLVEDAPLPADAAGGAHNGAAAPVLGAAASPPEGWSLHSAALQTFAAHGTGAGAGAGAGAGGGLVSSLVLAVDASSANRAGRAPTPPLLMSSTLVEALASLSAPERASDRSDAARRDLARDRAQELAQDLTRNWTLHVS